MHAMKREKGVITHIVLYLKENSLTQIGNDEQWFNRVDELGELIQ